MLRGALAGGIAAGVWALQQPLDKRVLRCGYDDVELLGRALLPQAERARWYPAGLVLHVQNGAMFGAVYAGVVAPALAGPVPAPLRGPLVAQVENFGLWPLGRVSDRFHPARKDLPRLTGNRRALAQATWRHLLFGVLLGELERRLNAQPSADPS
jgi:transposase InsO family protein